MLRIRDRLGRVRLRRALRPTGSVQVVRLGSAYGGWVVPMDFLDEHSIVYSVGVGEDVTFDLELIALTGCEVWAFDPTPRAIEFARRIPDDRFHFLPFGLWSSDDRRRFYAPSDSKSVSHSTVVGDTTGPYFEAECRSLDSIARELGHDHVDLLKLDVEGAEYEVLPAMPLRPRCICVEVHSVLPVPSIADFVHGLRYEIVHVDGWNVTLLDT